MAVKRGATAKNTTQDVARIRAMLIKQGAQAGDLDTVLELATSKSRSELVDGLAVWLRARPKATNR